MILLSGHSLTPARKVPLESMQLTLEEKNSTAAIVPADMTGITVNSWLKDDTNPGNGIVWRVRNIRQAFNSNTTTVSLEHAIGILKDTILFGDITTAKIAGKSTATEVTAKKAIQYILGKSADWTLGAFDYTDSNPYKFDGESLFDALETVTDSLDDPVWSYDFSSYPFKLNITKRNTGVDSELRANRNLRTITKSIDRSGMYTRMYPIGKDDLHIDGDYVEKNTAAYGVVAHVATDASLDTKKELKRWANQLLKKHAEPTVTIDVEGLELADATGEPLDRLTINRVCRIPLPEFGTTIQEKITRLSYADKVKQPESVKVTMANNRTDVTRIISDAIKRSGKGSRTSTKKGAEDRAWMEDTNDHVALCAKGIIGTDAQGKPNWERLSKIVVDGKGIHQTVTDVQNGMKNYESRLDQDEKRIGMVVGKYDSGGNYIKAGEIMLAINDDKSTAKIRADKVVLEGDISLNSVLKVLSNTATFTGLVQFGTDTATRIRIGSGWVSTPGVRLGSGTQVHQVNFAVLDKMIKTMESRSGGTIRLTRFDGTYLDFSKAITSFVPTAAGSGKIRVTAQPQNQHKDVPVSISGPKSVTTNGNKVYKIYFEDNSGDDVEVTGSSFTVDVDVYPSSKSLYCSAKSTAGGVTTYTFTYSSSSSSAFNTSHSYTFHHNSGYT
ncbi:MAG: phage tail protein [Clostridia bacterium]|nr:phage tail protein [Clostridia bacterium]